MYGKCILPILGIADKITFITATMKNDFFKKSFFHRGLRNVILSAIPRIGNMQTLDMIVDLYKSDPQKVKIIFL